MIHRLNLRLIKFFWSLIIGWGGWASCWTIWLASWLNQWRETLIIFKIENILIWKFSFWSRIIYEEFFQSRINFEISKNNFIRLLHPTIHGQKTGPRVSTQVTYFNFMLRWHIGHDLIPASIALNAQNTSVCLQFNPLAGLTITSPLIGHSRLNKMEWGAADGSLVEDSMRVWWSWRDNISRFSISGRFGGFFLFSELGLVTTWGTIFL